ncbi:hypothetical protein BD779DRAFT_1571504 [Infundibulicybe gibba]|nr:hypothetical protein BD779DRAFT_1571504 [Infundibulicybe gibba]
MAITYVVSFVLVSLRSSNPGLRFGSPDSRTSDFQLFLIWRDFTNTQCSGKASWSKKPGIWAKIWPFLSRSLETSV